MHKPRRIRLLGADLDLVTCKQVLAFTEFAVRRGQGGVIANHNLHSLYLYPRFAQMRALYRCADLIEIDSIPLIRWAAVLGHGARLEHRCTYLDWREAFWARASAEGWRVFFLGGAPGAFEQACAAIVKRWPGVKLFGRHGHFDMNGPENDDVLASITLCAPNILFVGMGMPRQEIWLAQNLRRLPPVVAFPIGGAFDYEAGVAPTPPRLTGKLGLEWLFRLICHPRRLARRYLVEPWSLLPAALEDLQTARRRKAAAEPPPQPAFESPPH